ncbi:MAG: hypothetical protein QM820_33130 [Minicystis sp.]
MLALIWAISSAMLPEVSTVQMMSTGRFFPATTSAAQAESALTAPSPMSAS